MINDQRAPRRNRNPAVTTLPGATVVTGVAAVSMVESNRFATPANSSDCRSLLEIDTPKVEKGAREKLFWSSSNWLLEALAMSCNMNPRGAA